MIMCLVVQIITRAFFSTSFAFTEELSRSTSWISINFFLVWVWACYDTHLIASEFTEISPTLLVVIAHVEIVIHACFLPINIRIVEKFISKYREDLKAVKSLVGRMPGSLLPTSVFSSLPVTR
ncbi:hypothetical protein [Desulfosediminicola ganghwensis]|uniref:hypothetical protein n=1 Tax=Desulfosediminicola ganghwensis TaxID=2569540 RepID=UPI0010AC4D30|nr:hypothetical protein [Desulfosediminicola ganghwensis]